MNVQRIYDVGKIGDLPIDMLMYIWQYVAKAAARARAVLRRRISLMNLMGVWVDDTFPSANTGWNWERYREMINQIARHWKQTRVGWTARDVRKWNRTYGQTPRNFPLIIDYSVE